MGSNLRAVTFDVLTPKSLIQTVIPVCPRILQNPEDSLPRLTQKVANAKEQLKTDVDLATPENKQLIVSLYGPNQLLLEQLYQEMLTHLAPTPTPTVTTAKTSTQQNEPQKNVDQAFFLAFRKILLQNMQDHQQRETDDLGYFKEFIQYIPLIYPKGSPEFFSCIQMTIEHVKKKMMLITAQNDPDGTKLKQLYSIFNLLAPNMPQPSEILKLLGIDANYLSTLMKPPLDSKIIHTTVNNVVQQKIATYYPGLHSDGSLMMALASISSYLVQETYRMMRVEDSDMGRLMRSSYANSILVGKPKQMPAELSYFGLMLTEPMELGLQKPEGITQLKVLRGEPSYDQILIFLQRNGPKMTAIIDCTQTPEKRVSGQEIIPYFLKVLDNKTLSLTQLDTLMRHCYEYQNPVEIKRDSERQKLSDPAIETFIINQINKNFEMLISGNIALDKKKLTAMNDGNGFLSFATGMGEKISIISDKFRQKIDMYLKTPQEHIAEFKRFTGGKPGKNIEVEFTNHMKALEEIENLSLTSVLEITKAANAYAQRNKKGIDSVNAFLNAQIIIFKNKCMNVANAGDLIRLQELKNDLKTAASVIPELKEQSHNEALKKFPEFLQDKLFSVLDKNPREYIEKLVRLSETKNQVEFKEYLKTLQKVENLSLLTHVIPIMTTVKATFENNEPGREFLCAQIEIFKNKCLAASSANDEDTLKKLSEEYRLTATKVQQIGEGLHDQTLMQFPNLDKSDSKFPFPAIPPSSPTAPVTFSATATQTATHKAAPPPPPTSSPSMPPPPPPVLASTPKVTPPPPKRAP